jgi:flavodoxin
MKKALVVYDSEFGNTKKIAEAIVDGLKSRYKVTLSRVNEAETRNLDSFELVVVGSPTQAFRPLPAVKEYLNELFSDALHGVNVAAFDTRFCQKDISNKFLAVMVKVFGYAAEPIGKRLVEKGGKMAAKPEGFCVKDTKGPLKDGEVERAKKWASKL